MKHYGIEFFSSPQGFAASVSFTIDTISRSVLKRFSITAFAKEIASGNLSYIDCIGTLSYINPALPVGAVPRDLILQPGTALTNSLGYVYSSSTTDWEGDLFLQPQAQVLLNGTAYPPFMTAFPAGYQVFFRVNLDIDDSLQ